MDFNELITDFATRHGVENLAVDDGAAAIEVDGIAVALADAGGDLLASAVIGEPPADGRAEFADLLLEANLELDAFFAKSKESGRYILSRRLPLVGLDGASCDAALESLVNSAETWQRLLEDFRPAAAEAAAKMEESAASGMVSGSTSLGGFMQV